MNMNFLPENEYTEFEGRRYLNPQLPVDATSTFVDNLRSTQQANNQQIQTQTQRLGTDVPSSLGGLTGAGSYFTSRYQTPQTNSLVAGLREAAQKQALTQALENEQAMWKKRYQDAYRAYQKRQYDASKAGTSTADKTTSGGTDYEDAEGVKVIEGVVPGISGGYSVPMIDTETGQYIGMQYVPYGEEYQTNYSVNFEDLLKERDNPLARGSGLALGENIGFSGR